MILKKRFRTVFDNRTKEILFSDEFDLKSTTHIGSGLSGANFHSKIEMREFLTKKNLTIQPETTKVI